MAGMKWTGGLKVIETPSFSVARRASAIFFNMELLQDLSWERRDTHER